MEGWLSEQRKRMSFMNKNKEVNQRNKMLTSDKSYYLQSANPVRRQETVV